METWTVDQIMALEPCEGRYPRSRVEQLFAGKDTVTNLDILEHPDVSNADKIWMCCRFNQHEDWLQVIDARVNKCANTAVRVQDDIDRSTGAANAARAADATIYVADVISYVIRAEFRQQVEDMKKLLSR